jgi:hypothetical protein
MDMDDRARAIALLRRAREALIERLTSRIVDSSDEILEDAHGLSFLGGIEEIYDQIGARLSHVNAMLQALPPSDFSSHEPNTASTADMGAPTAAEAMVTDTLGASLPGNELPALPAPRAVPALAPPIAWMSFRTFALQVQAGDLDDAGQLLADLFGVEASVGRRAAEAFARHFARDPQVLVHAMALRRHLAEGQVNMALALLSECFALQGNEALRAIETLRGRVVDR